MDGDAEIGMAGLQISVERLYRSDIGGVCEG